MKTGYAYRSILFACIIGIAIAWAGCTKEKLAATEEYGSLTVSFPYKSLAPGAASAIAGFDFVVEGSDFAPKVFPMVQEFDSVFGIADSIPVGRNRRVTARALDPQGIVLYQGSGVVDVAPGRTVRIDLTLLPKQPMLTITPRYQSMLMDDTIYVDVNVFNIPELSGITFDFIRNFSPTYVLSVVKGDQYGDSVALTYTLANDITTIQVVNRNQLVPIVDAQGNAHLATFLIPSYQDWGTDTATVEMNVSFTSGYGTGGGLPIEVVYSDGAIVELSRPLIAPPR